MTFLWTSLYISIFCRKLSFYKLLTLVVVFLCFLAFFLCFWRVWMFFLKNTFVLTFNLEILHFILVRREFTSFKIHVVKKNFSTYLQQVCSTKWSLFLSLFLSVHINYRYKLNSRKGIFTVTVNLFSSIALIIFFHWLCLLLCLFSTKERASKQ